MKKIVIVSGGLDSVTLLHQVVNKYKAENVSALTFDYGSKHNHKEIPMAEENCSMLEVKHRVINLTTIFDNFNSALLKHLDSEEIPEGHYEDANMKKTIVPFRNGILLSIAVGFAETEGADTVYYGAHSGDYAVYPDCRPEFEEAFSLASHLGTRNKVKIKAPFKNISKADIIKIGTHLGVNYGLTWTCYNPTKEGRPCGKCGSCIERSSSFIENGLRDPLYTEEEWEKIKEHTLKVIKEYEQV